MATSSPFLKLPPELRLQVYAYVIFSQELDGVDIELLTARPCYEFITPRPSYALDQNHVVKSYSFLFVHPVLFIEGRQGVAKCHPIDISSPISPLMHQTPTSFWMKICRHLVLDVEGWTAGDVRSALRVASSLSKLERMELRLAFDSPVQQISAGSCLPSTACPTHDFPSLTSFRVKDVGHASLKARLERERAQEMPRTRARENERLLCLATLAGLRFSAREWELGRRLMRACAFEAGLRWRLAARRGSRERGVCDCVGG